MEKISRRRFLQIAGGITFLGLVPSGEGFAVEPTTAEMPLFFVPPYIQPGASSRLIEGTDTLVVAWQTENLPANFVVEFGRSKAYGSTAGIAQGMRTIGKKDKAAADPEKQVASDNFVVRQRLNYSAALMGLNLATRYYYRVTCNGQSIAEGYASTRQPRGKKIRFVAFGDNSFGDLSDRATAYYAYQAHPDLVVNAGDNVYDSGLDNEYARYFFPIYNADIAGPHLGAPLLRSIPFYTVIANHDVAGKDDDGHAAADFDKDNDSLGYYTAMHLPLNGPAGPSKPTPTVCSDAGLLAQFTDCAGDRFPRMANYSFDYGDAHFLCLDSNDYVDPTDTALQQWITQDLAGTDARWKFVVYHHPAFNVGEKHYAEQQMRVLSPLLEQHGVDMVISGHEHTYQRTRPLRFAPGDMTKAADTTSKDRRVQGTFTVDRVFDGTKNTHPDGILYIVTGAGGKELYEPDFTDAPDRWQHADDNNADYAVKFFSHRHSLSVIDLEGGTLTMRQIDELGNEIDRITVTKA